MDSFIVKGRTFTLPIPNENEFEQNDSVSDKRMIILLNNKCNFNCIYCYSAHGRKIPRPELSFEDIIPGIDYICKKQEKLPDGYVNIRFYGGGEPFMSRDVLIKTIKYIDERANKLNHHIKIMTNGSLLKPDDIDWLKKYNVSLDFSFEVLEDIQMAQRGNYKKVDENIKMVDSAGINYRIWTVVTPRNVNRLDEMLQKAKHSYPNLKWINIELVVSDECTSMLQDEFLKSFFKVKIKAQELGVIITNSRIDCFKKPRKRHCQPELCITNDGYYTICHTTASHPGQIKDDFNFGNDLHSFLDNRNAVQEIMRKSSTNNCDKCLAKNYCAGGCIYANLAFPRAVVQSICRFMINSVKLQTLKKEDPELFNEYLLCNESFDDFASK